MANPTSSTPHNPNFCVAKRTVHYKRPSDMTLYGVGICEACYKKLMEVREATNRKTWDCLKDIATPGGRAIIDIMKGEINFGKDEPR